MYTQICSINYRFNLNHKGKSFFIELADFKYNGHLKFSNTDNVVYTMQQIIYTNQITFTIRLLYSNLFSRAYGMELKNSQPLGILCLKYYINFF